MSEQPRAGELRWQEAGHLEARPPSAVSTPKGWTRVWRWLERFDGNDWRPVALNNAGSGNER